MDQGLVTYDLAGIDQSITNSASVRDYMESISGNISTFLGSCDNRVLSYYSGDFTSALRGCKSSFNNDYDNMDLFGKWLAEQNSDLNVTNQNVNGIANSINPETINSEIGTVATSPKDASSLDLSCVVGTLGDVPTNPADVAALGLHFINPEAFQALPSEVQDAVKAALKNVGYDDNTIADIVGGKIGIKACVLDTVSDTLESVLSEHPDLRKTVIDLYGFDPFDDEGHVNDDLLTAILLIDAKDPNDQYDIIKLLHDQYGVDIVDPVQLSTLTGQLESVISAHPDIRAMLLQKYGFDIFNADGTINKSRLAIAMIMDKASGEDSFDLLAFLKAYNANSLAGIQNHLINPTIQTTTGTSDISSNVLTNVGAGLGNRSKTTSLGGTLLGATHNVSSNSTLSEEQQKQLFQNYVERVQPTAANSEAKRQNTAAIALGLGSLGALGVTGGGIAANKKEKEEKEEKEEVITKEEFDLFRTGDGIENKEDSKKDWLYGLGIGLAAAAGVGKALSDDEEDDEQESDAFQL